jgi:hypothetical protein
MLISKQLTQLPLGSFADLDKVRHLDHNRNGIIEVEDAVQACSYLTDGQIPESILDLYDQLGGARFPINILPSPETRFGLGIDSAMTSRGTFNAPELGRGHCLTRQQFNYINPDAPFHQIIAFRLEEFPATRLENDVASAAVYFGPRDFPLIPGEEIAAIACVPLDIMIEAERRYSHGTGGGYEREVKALVCAVERTDLANIAGDTGGVSFYAEVTLNEGRSFYINHDTPTDRNFLFASKEEFLDIGVA